MGVSKGTCLNTGRTWFPKGHVPWIAGRTHSEETRAKLRARWIERHRRGERIWNLGLTAETDERIRQYGLKQRGKTIPPEARAKMSAAKAGKPHMWRAGRTKDSGYVGILTHRLSGRYEKEHRVVAEKALGRKLKRDEVVHHINGNKSDNRPYNLLICTKSYHTWLHFRMSQLYMEEHFAEA